MPGESGRFLKVLPAVIIAVFTVSLIDCLFCHPTCPGGRKEWQDLDYWKIRSGPNAIAAEAGRSYRAFLQADIDHGYPISLSNNSCIRFFATYAHCLQMSGRVNFTFNPTIENDYIQGEIECLRARLLLYPRGRFCREAAAKRASESGTRRHSSELQHLSSAKKQ